MDLSEIENIYPAEFHFRIITDAGGRAETSLRMVLAGYDVTSPLAVSNASKGKRFDSFSVSVRLDSREAHTSLDNALRTQDGVRMVL